MGTIRIEELPVNGFYRKDCDVTDAARQAIRHTNYDLNTEITENPKYDLEKIQADALLVHSRQDISNVLIRTETIVTEIRDLKRLVGWAVGGIWLLLVFQFARLAGFSN